MNKYMDDNDLSPIPCPNCKGSVEITNHRDGNIVSSYAQCENNITCQGIYFRVDSTIKSPVHSELLQSDFEIVAIKYFYWAKSENKLDGYRFDNCWD